MGKPADTKPADTKPADTKPADTKPAKAEPTVSSDKWLAWREDIKGAGAKALTTVAKAGPACLADAKFGEMIFTWIYGWSTTTFVKDSTWTALDQCYTLAAEEKNLAAWTAFKGSVILPAAGVKADADSKAVSGNVKVTVKPKAAATAAASVPSVTAPKAKVSLKIAAKTRRLQAPVVPATKTLAESATGANLTKDYSNSGLAVPKALLPGAGQAAMASGKIAMFSALAAMIMLFFY